MSLALVSISGTDLTPYIDHKSYKMQQEPEYKSWTDGNFIEHRVYVRTRLKGSFKVWLAGINSIDTAAFLNLVNGATSNHVTTLTVYDNAANASVQITAFLQIKPGDHKEMINGNFYDTFTVEVTQK